MSLISYYPVAVRIIPSTDKLAHKNVQKIICHLVGSPQLSGYLVN